jgi:hypothetical protein
MDGMDRDEFRMVAVTRQAPSKMRYATRCAAIYTGEVLEQTAFEMEYDDAMVLACCCQGITASQRNWLITFIAGCLIEDSHRIFSPAIISLPFRKVYRGEIANHPDSVCFQSFRFIKPQLYRLKTAIRLQGDFILDNRSVYSGETILLASLYYLHKPINQDEVASFIGIFCQPDVSRMFAFFLDHLLGNYQHLIALDIGDSLNMWAGEVENFKRKLRDFHRPNVDSTRYNDVIGFVDGKLHRIARPGQRSEHTAIGVDTQRTVYNGYKKIHAVKFQATVAPNGMILQLSGGYRGRIADSTMLRRSGLNDMLQELSNAAGQTCCIYGDAAYPILSHIKKACGTREVENLYFVSSTRI